MRRAKAYEQMGHFKQALSDIQKANKADTANPDTQVHFYLAHLHGGRSICKKTWQRGSDALKLQCCVWVGFQ